MNKDIRNIDKNKGGNHLFTIIPSLHSLTEFGKKFNLLMNYDLFYLGNPEEAYIFSLTSTKEKNDHSNLT